MKLFDLLNTYRVSLLCIVFIVVFFVTDIVTPLGVAGGVPYVFVVVIASYVEWRFNPILIVSTITSFLVIAGALQSPQGADIAIVIANRILALCAIWTAAFVAINFKNVKKELVEGHNLVLDLQSMTMQGYWIWNLETDCVDGSVELRSIYEIDPSSDSISLDSFIGVVHPDDLEYERYHLSRAVKTGQSWDIEFRLLMPDGRIKHVWAIGKALKNDEGRIQRLMGVVQDITEKKIIEGKAQQSDKLQILGRVSAGMAHDVNNHLSGILNFANLIEAESNTDPNIIDHVKNIKGIIRRAHASTKGIVDFVGTTKCVNKIVNINEMILEIHSVFSISLDHKSQLELNLADDTLLVEGDAGQLQNAIMNIAINALEAVREKIDGKVTLESFSKNIQQIDIDKMACDAEPGRFVEVCVSDNGCGIASDVYDQVFEPFYSTKDPRKNSGLGLSAVLDVVRNHKGFLQLESSKNNGTTLCIYLPSSNELIDSPRFDRPNDFASPSLAQVSILLVDDEQMLTRPIQLLLEKAGAISTTFNCGEETLEWYETNWQTIDWVILDKNMPSIGGIKLYSKLKLINPQVKAVLATGYITETEEKLAIEMGIRKVISKPYSVEEINSALVS